MAILANYVMVAITIIFIIHIMNEYTNKKPNLIIGKISILIIALTGHGIILANNNYEKVDISILILNILIIVLLTSISSLVKFLEPIVWHIVAYLQTIGFIILHSLSPEKAYKQSLIAIIGFLIMLLLALMIYKINGLDKLTPIYIIASIILLFISNYKAFGATNWIEIGGVTFQPSEFVKIVFAFALAGIFNKKKNFKRLVVGSAYSAILILIFVYKKDLGFALLFFAVYMIMSYMYYRKKWLTALQVLALSGGAMIAYKIFGHIRIRVLAWLDPFSYIADEGYQVTQGFFAIANGKFMGTGLGHGSSKLVPAVTTDYIYTAICEEMGTIMAFLLLIVFIMLILMLLIQSQKTKTMFNAYVSVGITVMIAIQGFVILGGILRVIPLTGVTLPFISYGGTSLAMSILSVGIIEAVAKKEEGKKRQYRTHTIVTLKRVLSFLYVVLACFLMYFVVIQADDVELNSANKRLANIEKSIVRGTIYSRDGQILAKEEDGKRIYPFENMFAHVVGFVGAGKTGLEASLNLELLSSKGNVFKNIQNVLQNKKKDGNDIYLTLDKELQEVAYNSMANKKGAVVVMEVETGKILVMLSKPDFNPNTIETYYNTLLKNNDAILMNRATNGVYPPGSTFKSLTALTYIEQYGENFEYNCTGKEIFGNKYIHCYKNKAHGKETLKDAYKNSCNTAFATAGEKIDIEKLNEMAKRVYFNEDLPYDYNYKKSSFDLDTDATKELRAETVIGQGKTLITPLHNLLITSAIANGGQLMKPYLVDKVVNINGKEIEKYYPKNVGVLFETDEIKILKSYMQTVVENGTGRGLLNEKYTASGKTGSAENPFGKPHAWFVGYAPANNPKIAISIIVENSGTSSGNAVPIVRKIFDKYFEEN